jgi:hypothetical protein
MGKIRVGNKKNSILNGEWAGHVRGFLKKYTSSKRRIEDKRIIKQEIIKINEDEANKPIR